MRRDIKTRMIGKYKNDEFTKDDLYIEKSVTGEIYSKENPIKRKENQSQLSFLLSYIQFGWVTKWIYLGSRRSLPSNILPNLPDSDSTEYWSNLFENAVESERIKSMTPFDRKILVIRALWRCLYGQLVMLIVLQALWEVCQYVNNSVVRGFIRYKEMENTAELNGHTQDKYQALKSGLGHAVLLVLFHLIHVYVTTQFNFWESRVVLRIQTCLKTSIFKRLIESKSCARNLLFNGKEIKTVSKKNNGSDMIGDVRLDIGTTVETEHETQDRLRDDEFEVKRWNNKNISNNELETNYTASTNAFNLLMIDVDEIEDFLMAMTQFILLPCRLLIASLLMYKNIGKSAIPGVIVMILMILSMMILDVTAALLKGPLLYWRDKRLGKLHEVLNKVRGIKILGWIPFAEETVLNDRNKEIRCLYKIITLSALSFIFFKLAISGSVVAIMIYHTKSILNNFGIKNQYFLSNNDVSFDLKASNIVPLIHVINYVARILRTVPNSLNMLIEGWISLKRFSHHLGYSSVDKDEVFVTSNISDQLNSDLNDSSDILSRKHEETPLISKLTPSCGNITSDVKDDVSIEILNNMDVSINGDNEEYEFLVDGEIQVYLKDLIYKWESEDSQNDFKLTIPKMSIRNNSCHLIVGNTGSGKSTLLYGILGEIYSKRGLRYIRYQNNTMGYCGEDPWIPIGTIRSVILFERPWNEDRYNRVVQACLLLEDFSQWQEGDLRLLDDGGHVLSGGQRSRLTLARALYGFVSDQENYNQIDLNVDGNDKFDTRLFLFDDVFTSLDPNVGRRIFYNLFNSYDGLLTGKLHSTVIVLNITTLLCFLDEKLSKKEIDDKFGVEMNIWNINHEDNNKLELIEYETLRTNNKMDTNRTNLDSVRNKESEEKTFSKERNKSKEYILSRNSFDSKPHSYTSSDFYNEDIVCLQSESGRRTIPLSLYKWYISKVGFFFFFIISLLIVLNICLDNGQDFLLVEWTGFTSDGRQMDKKSLSLNSSDLRDNLDLNRDYLYGLIIIFLFALSTRLLVKMSEIYASVGAANRIHNEMLKNVLTTSLDFFDRNAIGQIINRFCLDMMSIDKNIMFRLCSFISILFEILIRGGFIICVFPWLIFLIPLICSFVWYWLFQYYRHTARELFRSNLSSHTPVCNIYTQALMGGTVIRAFKCENVYLLRNISYIDNLQKIRFMRSGSSQWISVRMQLLMLPFTAVITLLPILLRYFNIKIEYFTAISMIDVTAGSWGLALIYAMSYAPLINDSFNVFTSVEKSMCAVERISLFLKDLKLSKTREFNEDYHKSLYESYILNNEGIPRSQGLYIHKLRIEYDEKSLGIELRNEFVGYGECIGIIGRTGSGKTTFLNALLGLTPVTTGLIFLDNIWLFSKEMRFNKNSFIGVLPQDSIGFNGWTIRKFLDPFEEVKDDQLIWDGIISCGLENTIRSLNSANPLEAKVSGFSGELSSGHRRSSLKDKECKFTQKNLRQLALARLLIHRHKYKIILVDEPPEELLNDHQNYSNMNSNEANTSDTTNNDNQYLLVEEIISKYMKHCIVFIVAHNYKSLKSCNRIWVLSSGTKVNECSFSQVNNQKLLADFLLSNSKK